MREYPAYRISMYPGCEKARIQTCENATRRLCSYVSALAAYERTGEISGTLTKAPEGRIEFWISCMLLEFGITIEHLALWVRSINGSPFTRELPETALGLTPDPYQISAMRGMTEAGGCIGGFMGSGKTLMGTMLAMAESAGGNERCWIFGPLNSFPAWERVRDQELNKYFKEVKILSIDSAHRYTGVSRGDVLIVDECHRAGGAEARRTKSIHTIRSKFRFGLGLSGTFVHSGVEKVASVKDVAVPGLAMFASKWEMGAAFNCMAKKNIGSRNVMALERPTGAAKERFMQWLEHGIYLIRPEAEDVRQAFTLPGQTTQQVSFLSPWSSLVDSVARGAHAILAETGELPHAQAVAHWLGREGAEEKVDWVLGELRELPDGTQLAIAANYTNTLDLLEAALKEEGYTYVRVDGAVVGADRSAAERNFQQGHAQVFIGQIHAASESMNLQCANISLTLDVSTSAVDYSQWLCRTHRRGQTTHCVHVDLVANKYQNHVLERLRLGQDFASDCAEYAELRRTVSTFNLGSGESP